MPSRVVRALTGFEVWLGLATLVFVVWYAVFLFRFRTLDALVTVTTVASETLPLVPAVRTETLRLAVGVVVHLGIPLSVVAFAVGFALFHRQADTV